MTDKNTLNDKTLEALLSEMGDQEPVPSDALLHRIMGDADAVIDAAGPVAVPQVTRPGFWAEMRNALGGWTAIAGLGTATIAGIWIGVVSPASVTSVTDQFLPTLTAEELSVFTPDFDRLVDEG